MLELFPYQADGAKFLSEKGRALLADEPGLGKTAQAIRACDDLGANYVVVVCPASVVENWRREFARFSFYHWTGNLIVLSYDRVVRDGTDPDHKIDVLILDEAHYLKNRKAKRTQAIFGPNCDGKGGLVEHAKHVFALTGTPAPNNPAELWPLLRALAPETIMATSGKPQSYWAFQTKYCVTRHNGFGIQIVRGKNLDTLKARIAPFTLRRKKEDVLRDLPGLRIDELSLQAADAIKAVRSIENDPAMQRIVEALEAAGAAGLVKIAPHVAELRRAVGLAKVGPVIEWVKDWFESGGGKLVLFAHHRDVVRELYDSLREFGPCAITGATPTHDRYRLVEAFQAEPHRRIFIGQIQAAGIGINLTAASDAVFVESSWVPAENEQAMMRIHRIGQHNACLVRFATLVGSLDERIQRVCMRKAEDIRRLFG